MKETNISAPDANITITDNIIYNTRTIKIDRNKLLELYEKMAKLQLPYYCKYPKLKPKRSSR